MDLAYDVLSYKYRSIGEEPPARPGTLDAIRGELEAG